MISTLLGLVGIGGLLAWVGLAPKVLEIILELAKAFLKGIVAYLGQLWNGLRTATFAHWTVILTAFVVGYLWSGTRCTAFYGAANAYPQAYSAPSARGATSTIPKIIDQRTGKEFNWTPRDIFCYWYGCL